MVVSEETYPLVNHHTYSGTPVVSYSSNSSSSDDTLRVVEEGRREQTCCKRSNQLRARSNQRPITPDHLAKEAIVYLGGMDHGKQVTRFVSSRLAAKLNQAIEERDQQQPEKNRFMYKARGHFGYGKRLPRASKEQYSDLLEFETVRHTIYLVEEKASTRIATRKASEDKEQVTHCEWPIADVFQLDYLESMSSSWRENRSLLVQTMAMALAMVYYVISSVSAFFRILLKKFLCCRNNCLSGGSSGVLLGQLVQFSIIVFLFVLLLAYFAILIAAVSQTLLGFLWMMGDNHRDPEITTMQQITLLATFVGFIAPQICHRAMVNTVVDYTAVVYYLKGVGPLRTKLCDQLDALIKRIQERWNYDRVHIVAYSFGALLAIDALFPEDKTETPPEYKMVDHFVTFGCPVDMVRTLLPRYYSTNRCYFSSSSQSNGNNMRWTNFFVPGDALGSNFRNDTEIDRNPDAAMIELKRVPDKNIAIEPVAGGRTNLLDLIGLCLAKSIRLHVKHWSDQPDTRDVSNELVNVIFEDHWVLAEQTEPRFDSTKC